MLSRKSQIKGVLKDDGDADLMRTLFWRFESCNPINKRFGKWIVGESRKRKAAKNFI